MHKSFVVKNKYRKQKSKYGCAIWNEIKIRDKKGAYFPLSSQKRFFFQVMSGLTNNWKEGKINYDCVKLSVTLNMRKRLRERTAFL